MHQKGSPKAVAVQRDVHPLAPIYMDPLLGYESYVSYEQYEPEKTTARLLV
jgi:hypothetical protein